MAADFLCEVIENREIAREIFDVRVRALSVNSVDISPEGGDLFLPPPLGEVDEGRRGLLPPLSEGVKANCCFNANEVSRRGQERFLPGQFAQISVPEFFLRRPVSIAGYEPDKNEVEFIIQAVGDGTKKLTSLKAGSELKILMPLGRPFPVDDVVDAGNIWLVSGGIGLAPLLFCAEQIFNLNKKLNKNINIEAFAGFRDNEHIFGVDRLKKFCGAVNLDVGGIVTDFIAERLRGNDKNIKRPDYIFACGPRPFLAALKALCEKYKLKCYASLEEAMGCGIGACLTCSCKINNNSEDWHYARVCRDGPVFEIDSVIF